MILRNHLSQTQFKAITLGIVVLIVLGLGVWYYNSDYRAQQQFEAAVAELNPDARAEVSEFMEKARQRFEDSRASDTDLTGYIDAGRYYKMLGTVHGLEYGYTLAIEVYEEALQNQGQNNALIYAAAADAYKLAGDMDTTREYYGRAIVLEPGNAQRYTDLATHLRYNYPDEPVETVLAVYQEGLDRVVFGGDEILRDRARYLEEVAGDKVGAYQDWSRLLLVFPNSEPIQEEVNRLRAELQAEGVDFEEVTTTTSAE